MHEERNFGLMLVEESDMTPDLDRAIRELLCRAFEADVSEFSVRRAWNGIAPEFTVAYRPEDDALGHIGIVFRDIRCGDRVVKIAGIQSLAVDTRMRGTGLSHKLESVAMEEAAKRGVKFGLLFCVPELEKFYAGLGWKTTRADVVMQDADGNTVPLTAKNIAMTKDLVGEAFPSGDIDLQGRDW